MDHELVVGSQRLLAACGEDLQRQAHSLLEMLARLHTAQAPLHDAMVVEFGWAPLKLMAEGDALRVCEPDYDAGASRFRPQVDATLRVLAQQAAVVQATGAPPRAARFDQIVHVAPGALTAERIGLVRRVPVDDADSGWFIGALDGDVSADAERVSEAMPVHRLWRERPAVLKLLALPLAYSAALQGQTIINVVNEQGQPVWPYEPG